MNRIIPFLILVLILLVSIRIWFGIYVHDEFGDTELFLKHRPAWKWKFYSPIGMSDLRFENLSEKQKQEQLFFKEFITDQGLSR